jgi:hypothetical protein
MSIVAGELRERCELVEGGERGTGWCSALMGEVLLRWESVRRGSARGRHKSSEEKPPASLVVSRQPLLKRPEGSWEGE